MQPGVAKRHSSGSSCACQGGAKLHAGVQQASCSVSLFLTRPTPREGPPQLCVNGAHLVSSVTSRLGESGTLRSHLRQTCRCVPARARAGQVRIRVRVRTAEARSSPAGPAS